MCMQDDFKNADSLTRRAFLGRASAGLLGLGLMPMMAPFAGAAEGMLDESTISLGPATAKNVIYLYMSGGMSHLDTLDPKPGAATQGPVSAIDTNVDGIQLTEYFPNLAQHMDKCAIINSMNSTQGAHTQARYFVHTSYNLRGTIKHPSLGAWLGKFGGRLNQTLPGHIEIGGDAYTANAGFFESEYRPLPIGNPTAGLQHSKRNKNVSEKVFSKRLKHLHDMDQKFSARYSQKEIRAYTQMYDQAIKLMKSRDLAAFDISQEKDWVRESYGDNRFGQGCLLARRLIENRVRFVEVVDGGWDTHSQNWERIEERAAVVDRALGALLSDLDARGLLDETLVVLTTEFGRTPDIQTERVGRNHYPRVFSSMLAGGGIRGGQKYGKSDAEGRTVVENPVSVTDFNATIGHALGIPLDHTVYSPSKRPFTLADKGKPHKALFI